MGIVLNKEGYTPEQLAAVEPLMSSAASYERKIRQKKHDLFRNPTMEYDQEKRVKGQINAFEKKHKELTDQIDDILNARNVYEEKLELCRTTLEEADGLKKKWGF